MKKDFNVLERRIYQALKVIRFIMSTKLLGFRLKIWNCNKNIAIKK